MKKGLLLLMLIVLMTGSFSAFAVQAQDDEMLPSCDPEYFAAAAEEMGAGFMEIEDIMAVPDDPTSEDIATAAITADALAYGFWEAFFEGMEEEDACLEIWWLGYTGGLVLDELLVISQLGAVATYEEEAGNSEISEALLELFNARLEQMMSGLEELGSVSEAIGSGEMIDIDLPECTQEELDDTLEGMDIIASAYEELGGMAEEASGEDLSALVMGFATLSNGYWEEVYPVIPECYEVSDLGFTMGLILDESLIVVSNMRLAELASDAGHDDLAEVFAESAAVRAEELVVAIEDYFGTEE